MTKYFISVNDFEETEIQNYYDALKYINQLSFTENNIIKIRSNNQYQLVITKNSNGYCIEDHSTDLQPKWAFIDCLKIEGLRKILTSFFSTTDLWRTIFSWNMENPKYKWLKQLFYLSVFLILIFMKKSELITNQIDEFFEPIVRNGHFIIIFLVFFLITIGQIDHFLNFNLVTNTRKLKLFGYTIIFIIVFSVLLLLL